jgi:hypothetical protein
MIQPFHLRPLEPRAEDIFTFYTVLAVDTSTLQSPRIHPRGYPKPMATSPLDMGVTGIKETLPTL